MGKIRVRSKRTKPENVNDAVIVIPREAHDASENLWFNKWYTQVYMWACAQLEGAKRYETVFDDGEQTWYEFGLIYKAARHKHVGLFWAGDGDFAMVSHIIKKNGEIKERWRGPATVDEMKALVSQFVVKPSRLPKPSRAGQVPAAQSIAQWEAPIGGDA